MTRWDRLADTLADVTPVEVVRFGESCQINIRSGHTLIVIHDTWWRKNLDVWTGWEVHIEDLKTSLTKRTYPKTKKRGEVRRNVADALAAVHR